MPNLSLLLVVCVCKGYSALTRRSNEGFTLAHGMGNTHGERTRGRPWDSTLYDERHSFVWKLCASVIDLLVPQPGELILDVGCGTGQLTAQISESGATVVGIDNSPAMIEEARRLFPEIDFQLVDAHAFSFEQQFDGIFSNAALHWISDPAKVARCISGALKANGRMAVEFGGQGNVRFLAQATETASQEFLDERLPHPWFRAWHREDRQRLTTADR